MNKKRDVRTKSNYSVRISKLQVSFSFQIKKTKQLKKAMGKYAVAEFLPFQDI